MALRKRLSGDDDTLRREIIEAEEERRAFLAEHELLREDAHERIDQALGECLARAEQLAAEHRHVHGWPISQVDGKIKAFSPTPWPAPYFEVAALHHAATDPSFRAMLHAAVDGPALHGAPGVLTAHPEAVRRQARELPAGHRGSAGRASTPGASEAPGGARGRARGA